MNGKACLYPPVFVVFLPYLEQYEMTRKTLGANHAEMVGKDNNTTR